MNSASALNSMGISLLLNLTLLGASVALGVAITFKFIPTSLPRTRYLIALAAFGAATLIPILATMGLTMSQPPSNLKPPAITNIMTATANTSLTLSLPSAERPAPSALASFRNGVRDFARRLTQHSLAPVLLWLWAGVSVLLLGREAIGHLGLLRARRRWQLATAKLRREMAWPSHIPLYFHQHAGPSAVGWLRPAVVLPWRLLSDLRPQAITQVARHELAHARWRDPLANALVRLIRALLWPSLPLWFLEHLAHTEREAAADQAAITNAPSSTASKQVALDYAASLVSIAEWERAINLPRSFSLLGSQVGGRKSLEHRVSRLLKTSPRLNPVRLALGMIALLGGCVGLGWLPVAVADQSAKLGRFDMAERPVVAAATQSAKEPPVPAKPEATNRENDPASLKKGSVTDRVTPPRQTTGGEIEKPLPARAEGGTQTSARKEITPPYPNNTVIFNGGGVPGSAVLIRQTDAGQIEEPILNRSEAETQASAIEQVTPPYPAGLVSESRFTGVMVSILIDQDGEVFSARAIAGNRNPELEQRAVEAARQWKFTPATMEGKPIKVVSTLTFFGSLDRSRGWVEIR